MGMAPPKVLAWPKPMSSIRKTITLGAPLGAVTWNLGGAVGVARVELGGVRIVGLWDGERCLDPFPRHCGWGCRGGLP